MTRVPADGCAECLRLLEAGAKVTVQVFGMYGARLMELLAFQRAAQAHLAEHRALACGTCGGSRIRACRCRDGCPSRVPCSDCIGAPA